MARRRVRGDRAFRRILRKLDPAVREEIVLMYDEGGDQILAMQRADATVSGRVRSALSKRILRGGLQLKVGLVGRPVNRRLWWSRVIEKGRKASIEDATRITRGKLTRYRIRVPALAAMPAIYSPRVLVARQTLGGRTAHLWEKALARASQGVSDE